MAFINGSKTQQKVINQKNTQINLVNSQNSKLQQSQLAPNKLSQYKSTNTTFLALSLDSNISFLIVKKNKNSLSIIDDK